MTAEATAVQRPEAHGLVGREELLAELVEALAASRLVTLVGPGGVGKTALATAAAASTAGDVRVVELVSMAPADDLAPAVIDALGLRNESLVHALAGRDLLLVLDNCEHLVDAVARLAGELLNGCPGLRMLATSREALRVPGETRFAVPGLAQDDAVRLFAERARAADPMFRLDAATLPTVERICALLDGLPLAIELAAGRVDSVPLEDITIAFLHHERRTDSLRKAIVWSWDLLPPVERVIAARLAIFSGGANAESVAAVLDLPQPVATRLLAALTERSLLTLTNGRYRMPETIRAYAGEQLTPAETDDLRARQAAYLLRLVRQADPHLRGPDQLLWASSLKQESDNLRAAIRWAVEHDQRLGLELVAGLSTYWWMHGLRGEAARAAHGLLAVLGEVVPDGLAEEYLLAALHAAGSGRVDGVEQARAIVEELDEPFRHPITVLLWSLVLGPFAPPEFVSEVLDRNELSTDPWTLAALQLCAGYPGLTGTAAVDAEGILQSALTQFQLIGDRWGISLALNALAELAAWSNRLDLSAKLIGQALSIADELGSDEEAALLLCRRGDLHLRLGELGAAEEDYGQALVRAERVGLPESSAAARIGLARTARYDGNLPKAQELAEQAMADCPAGWVGADLATTEILSELAAIAAAAGNPPVPCGSGHSR
ncbi:ATP-binding protein [Kribbella catacumbae]|uniref:ATP-binding protein n=1 Tax=Kribbella catacumbae TaxID=460086 RepID=UPI000361F27C|nr:tetratricopeptide repeat protein [Kribbella catacumbae]